MMIDELVKLCDSRYKLYHCFKCPLTNCPNSCQKEHCERCLKSIHFNPQATRRYDCMKMMDFYVCKYAYKYTSELIYAFQIINNINNLTNRKLNILSIGCGPCTDLLALDWGLCRTSSVLDYRGIELNTAIWRNIHADISKIIPQRHSYSVIPSDICIYINNLLNDENWKPDLIVLQYVLSDMSRNMQKESIYTFIQSLAQYFYSCKKGTCIVCNDVNLSSKYHGGCVDFFDYIAEITNNLNKEKIYKCHFKNDCRGNCFHYGDEYISNKLIVTPCIDLCYYKPFNSCSSAQMLIVKEE